MWLKRSLSQRQEKMAKKVPKCCDQLLSFRIRCPIGNKSVLEGILSPSVLVCAALPDLTLCVRPCLQVDLSSVSQKCDCIASRWIQTWWHVVSPRRWVNIHTPSPTASWVHAAGFCLPHWTLRIAPRNLGSLDSGQHAECQAHGPWRYHRRTRSPPWLLAAQQTALLETTSPKKKIVRNQHGPYQLSVRFCSV